MDPSSALTDEEYRQSLGSGYIFFEITEPEQLSFTYKVETCIEKYLRTEYRMSSQANPAVFAPSWNVSHTGIHLVPTEPPCGCGFIQNADQVEGKLALIERGECSFVSKVIRAQSAGAVLGAALLRGLVPADSIRGEHCFTGCLKYTQVDTGCSNNSISRSCGAGIHRAELCAVCWPGDQ